MNLLTALSRGFTDAALFTAALIILLGGSFALPRLTLPTLADEEAPSAPGLPFLAEAEASDYGLVTFIYAKPVTDSRCIGFGSGCLAGWHGLEYNLPARDYVAGCGAEVLAPIDGVVNANSFDGACGQYGCNNSYLTITGERLKVWLLHGHWTPHPGETVQAGQVVGTEASLGNSSGCHTHFTIMDLETGRWVDPFDIFGK